MKVSVGAATDIGQVREGNEDSPCRRAWRSRTGWAAIEAARWRRASRWRPCRGCSSDKEGSLAEQVAEANRAVFDRSQNDRSVSGMGTTLTAALVEGPRAPGARRRLPRVPAPAASSPSSPRTTRSSTAW